MSKYLVVVDMQKDFVDGSLGTKEAVSIVSKVKARIEAAVKAGEKVVFTRDTHLPEYLQTQEGKHLPVEHCIKGTEGWQVVPELRPFTEDATVVDKPTFGSRVLGEMLSGENAAEPIEEITLIGLCTDICVISNAMLLKAFLPEVPIAVEADLCAGVTPESHARALEAMQVCQVTVR